MKVPLFFPFFLQRCYKSHFGFQKEPISEKFLKELLLFLVQKYFSIDEKLLLNINGSLNANI